MFMLFLLFATVSFPEFSALKWNEERVEIMGGLMVYGRMDLGNLFYLDNWEFIGYYTSLFMARISILPLYVL